MSNNKNGYIMLSNWLINSQIWHDLQLLWLFVYFCLRVEIEDNTKVIKWQEIKILKWQCLYFQKHISEVFGLSIWKINKSIKMLKKYWLCENKNTNKYSIIEPINIITFNQPWKQNENKMKTKWNNINNNNNYNNIYTQISKIWESEFWIKENIEDLTIEINIEEFQKSFNNYLKILKSKFTFYHYKYKLRDFILSPNWLKKFLHAKFEDFLDWRKMEEYEIQKTKEKREIILKLENENDNEISSEQNKKLEWFNNFIKSNYYLDNKDNIRHNILIESPKSETTENIFLAHLKAYCCKNYYKK